MLEYNPHNYEKFVFNEPEINLYTLKNHYILNQPKTASSYMDSYTKTGMGDRVHFSSETFNLVSYWIGEENETTKEKDKQSKKYKEFAKDWNNLIQKKPTKRKFVFLVRNPIQRFIAGITQDFVAKGQEKELEKDIVEIKEKESSPNNIFYPEWSLKNGLHQEQYEDKILSRLKFFYEHPSCMLPRDNATEVPHIGDGTMEFSAPGYMGGGHIKDFIFFYYGLFDKLNGCSPKSPLSIIDINIQSLHNTLWDWGYRLENQSRGPKRNDDRQHVKPKLLNTMVRYLICKKGWGDVTNEIQNTNTQAWIQLVRRQYGYMDFDGSNSNIHSIEDYFNDTYITGKDKTWQDIINIESHQSWCSKESVETLEKIIRTYNKANPEFTSQRDISKDHDAAQHVDNFGKVFPS